MNIACHRMRFLPLGLGVICLLASTALAHKVNLFAYVEGGRVYVEAYFGDGRPAENSKIVVQDSQKGVVLEGVTDKEGKFNFAITKIDALTIVLDAGMGHKNSFVLQKAEVEAGK